MKRSFWLIGAAVPVAILIAMPLFKSPSHQDGSNPTATQPTAEPSQAPTEPSQTDTADDRPLWAFFVPDKIQPKEAPRDGIYQAEGSKLRLTQAEISNLKSPPDWLPDAHPKPPKAVTTGGAGFAWACGSCHLMSGMGHPESASLAGLPLEYLQRQMADFKSGARANHVINEIVDGKPRLNALDVMPNVAKAWKDSDVQSALAYFAGLPPLQWVKVVERSAVPKSYINMRYIRVPAPGGGFEPLGQRIIELPEDVNRDLILDPNSGTVAYVPVGAVARGKALARANSCASCHGETLTGSTVGPPLAGRSPVYIFRQLYLFKQGSRNGSMAGMMKGVADGLGKRDMIDLAAYAASLPPPTHKR